MAALCRIKVAEQLLEAGAKAGIAGLAGAAIRDVVDKMTSDELNHLVTLEMMNNGEITGKYLNSLQGNRVFPVLQQRERGGECGRARGVGRGGGELAARYIAEQRFGSDTQAKIDALSEDQRQELSLMSTLAAGLAGGLAGNSAAAATTGAQAGKMRLRITSWGFPLHRLRRQLAAVVR